MEFTLKYRGALPGGSASGKVEYKHSIRKAFHEQLADYWQRDTRLKGLKPSEFHEAQKSDKFFYDVPRPVQGTQNFFYRAPCRGIEFVPLVIRIRYSPRTPPRFLKTPHMMGSSSACSRTTR